MDGQGQYSDFQTARHHISTSFTSIEYLVHAVVHHISHFMAKDCIHVQWLTEEPARHVLQFVRDLLAYCRVTLRLRSSKLTKPSKLKCEAGREQPIGEANMWRTARW